MNNYDILKEYEAHKTPVPSYEEWQQLKEQINHLLKTQARQFVDNQKLQVKAEKAKDVVNIDTARQIKRLKELLKECGELFVLEKGFMVKCIREETLSDIIAKIDEALR